MLTGQRFQAELSPSFLWKFTEFRAETPPHAFGIPNCVTPPRLRNSSPRNPPSPSEFQDAARGMVWIFSGITHFGLTDQTTKRGPQDGPEYSGQTKPK